MISPTEKGHEIPQKIKHDVLFDPVIPLLGMYLKKPQTQILKNISVLCVHCSVIYNHQDMEAAEMAISR